MAVSKEDILETISNMSVMDVVDLISAMEEKFGVSAAALGTLSAYYFYSYAIMQIPVGLIVDHFGPHRA